MADATMHRNTTPRVIAVHRGVAAPYVTAAAPHVMTGLEPAIYAPAIGARIARSRLMTT